MAKAQTKRRTPKKAATPAANAVKKLKGIPSGYVTDALARLGLSGWMDGVVPIKPDDHFVGPAVTVRYGPRRGVDQVATSYYALVRTFAPGSVVVVDACGTDNSVMGGNMAMQTQVAGAAAVVTDGRCRDRPDMGRMKMPIFCRGATIRLPDDLDLVAYDVSISCGGAQVNPGDIILGDADGVVVIPASQIDAVVYQVEEIAGIEADLERTIAKKGSIDKLHALLKRKKAKRV